MRFLFVWWLAFLPLSTANASGRLFTYFEGHLVKKSAYVWVLDTDEGTYWINVARHPNWLRKSSGNQVSFWVGTDQIVRYRPYIETPMHEDRKVEGIARASKAPQRSRRRRGLTG